MIQRLASWLAFNIRVSKLFALYQSFRHVLVNQLLLRADPCGNLVQLIDWLIGPQKLFFTFLNQFNLGHASTQSCELPKRPILHFIKIEGCCTAHLQKNKTTALRKKMPKLSWRQSLTLYNFSPEVDARRCKCETMPYCQQTKWNEFMKIHPVGKADGKSPICTLSQRTKPPFWMGISQLSMFALPKCRHTMPPWWLPFLVPRSQRCHIPGLCGTGSSWEHEAARNQINQ